MRDELLAFLIDDDLDDQEFFSLVMEETYPSIKCVFANDGILALEKLNTDTSFIPHLILIDVNMPRMNGFDCLTEIRKLGHLWRSHIYMYSTSADPSMVEKCLAVGAHGFIKKVPTTEALQKKMLDVISKLEIQLA